MERALLYVSRKTIAPQAEDAEIEDIVTVARSRNAVLGVTGGLISTPDCFAQLLEGPAEAVEELMRSIDRDARHTDVSVVRIDAITRRRLPDWSMAYSGPSNYVTSRIAPLLGTDIEGDPRRIDRLMDLIVQFATT